MKFTIATLFLLTLLGCQSESSKMGNDQNDSVDEEFANFGRNPVSLSGQFTHHRHDYSGPFQLKYGVARVLYPGDLYKGTKVKSAAIAMRLSSELIDCRVDFSKEEVRDGNSELYDLNFLVESVESSTDQGSDPGFSFGYTFHHEGWVNLGGYGSANGCGHPTPCLSLINYSYGDRQVRANVEIDYYSEESTGIDLQVSGKVDIILCQ